MLQVFPCITHGNACIIEMNDHLMIYHRNRYRVPLEEAEEKRTDDYGLL